MAISSLPVIDLFAGPGGLAEGFSAYRINDWTPYDVRLSIEKDPIACATLRLRKFFRQFEEAPSELKNYFLGQAPLSEALGAYPREAASAQLRVWHAELGTVDRNLTFRRVRDALQGARDWVLLGGPPCQAYSVAGRSRMRNTRPDFEQDERHFLYREYLQIVADHEPAVFVLENVKGLLTSKIAGKPMVTRILDDLAAPAKSLGLSRPGASGYRLYALGQRQSSLPWMNEAPPDGEEFLLRAEDFGIPQMRHRIFIVGVRGDIPYRPEALQPKDQIPAGSVLADLPALRSQLTREPDCIESWRSAVMSIRSCSWMSTGNDSQLTPVTREIRRIAKSIAKADLETGADFVNYASKPAALADWYRGGAVGLTHHESRSHMRSDLHRYLFAAAFAHVHCRSPELQHFPSELQPAHRNVEQALEGDMFNDRFRVQMADRPSTTITSHIRKDGHYYIHYDPAQCRSLTVREAARLQTFPDSYFFEGTRTEKYHQIGNAVPPLLARAIARAVHNLLLAAEHAPRPSSLPGRRRSQISRADRLRASAS